MRRRHDYGSLPPGMQRCGQCGDELSLTHQGGTDKDGDPVCSDCAAFMVQCDGCSNYYPEDANLTSAMSGGLRVVLCGSCRDGGRRGLGLRRHPAWTGSKELDAQAEAAMERDEGDGRDGKRAFDAKMLLRDLRSGGEAA